MVCILTAWKRDLLLLMQRTKIKTFFPMKRTLQYFLFLTTIKIGRTLRDVFGSYQFALDFLRASSKTWWSIERDVFFRLVTSIGQRKNCLGFIPWGIEAQTFQFHPQCSNHWATDTPRWARSITKFMIPVLHTVRISNVDSIMFVDRNKRDGKFWTR